MRLHKRSISTAFLAVILAAVLFGCGKVQSGDTAAPDPSDIVSERDDFYEAVNGELLAQWEIEPDESVTNWFIRLTDQNTELITEIIKRTVENDTAEKGSDESNIRALYLTGMDQEARNEAGYGRILTAFFEEVDGAKTPSDLMRCCLEFDRNRCK